MNDADRYNIWWINMVYLCLSDEGKRELLESAEDIMEFYRTRAEFTAPPLPDPQEISLYFKED